MTTDRTSSESGLTRNDIVQQIVKPMFVLGGMYTEASGVVRIVCDLANAMAALSGPVTVYTAECRGKPAVTRLLDKPNKCVAVPGWWCGRMMLSPALNDRLNSDMQAFDVVHNHSIWMLPNHYAATAARRARTPVVYTAHGALEPWALRRSRWKKRLMMQAYQRSDLRQAACLHVNSESELKGIRDLGFRNPVAVIPNGVSMTRGSTDQNRAGFERLCPSAIGRRTVLFLSRLHEKKGLDCLVSAWQRLERDFPDWHLVIAGPDDGFEDTLRSAVTTLGIESSVTLTGGLFGNAKADALHSADVFVLPSYSEGFPMAVLEAMSASLPVLVTPGCNMGTIPSHGAGIEVVPDATSVQAGLRELMELTDQQRQTLGENGRRLVEEKYVWEKVAGSLHELYDWIIRGGQRPDSVHLT